MSGQSFAVGGRIRNEERGDGTVIAVGQENGEPVATVRFDNNGQVHTFLSERAPMHEADAPVIACLSDVAPERLSWLWDGRFPAGKLVILDGDPSVGKSTLTVDWAARVSTGKPWPDDAPSEVGDVIVMSAEDGLADTIRPRLDAAEGDPARVHALTATRTGDKERTLTLADVATIETAVRQTGAVLVIIDVLMAYMPTGTNAHRDQDVRTVLAAMAGMADRTGAVVLCLRHLNKSGGGNAMYRGGGSIGIIGAARAGYVAAPDPDDDTRRLLACVKSNLAEIPPTLAYRLVSADNGTARVEWLGKTQHSAGDVLADREDDDERSERDAAAEWLRELLADGPVKSAEVYSSADAAGLSKDQAKRAKKKIGATATHPDIAGPWFWAMPTKGAPREQGSTVGNPAPLAPLGTPLGACRDCGADTIRADPTDPATPLCFLCGGITKDTP